MELHRAEHAYWCKKPNVTTQNASQFPALFNELAGNSQGGTIGAREPARKVHSIPFLRTPCYVFVDDSIAA
jgi:hypothetical protein